MKVKLLKKVRNRFSITHHPKGIVCDGKHYNHNIYVLTDKEKIGYDESVQLGRSDGAIQWSSEDRIFENEVDCIYYLTKIIINRLISEGYRTRKLKQPGLATKKVWYVKK